MNKAIYNGKEVYIRAEFEINSEMVLVSYSEDGPAFKVNVNELTEYNTKK